MPGADCARMQQTGATTVVGVHQKRAGWYKSQAGPLAPQSERAPSCWLLLGVRRQGPTELVADPTMISPVVVSVSGRQPKIVQPPPVTLCSTTWIMFTVMPLLVTPSPVGI